MPIRRARCGRCQAKSADNTGCLIEHFGNADAVPQLPERCLSRKAGIVRYCLIYKGHIGVRRSGALPLRPGPIVWRHKITDAPPAKRRSICSDHIFVARIGVLHQVGQCHAVQVFTDHTVQPVPQRIGAAFRHARAGRGTFFQAGNSCQGMESL